MNAKPPADFDAALKQWLGEKPGSVSAAWIDAEGVAYFNAGRFSAADPRPVTSDTEYEIGSLTKVFTALLLADAVQAGKVTLDASIGAPFEGSAVTYRQLATHTSGLPRIAADFSATDPLDPYASENLEALVSSFRAAAPGAKPSASAYSNFGFAVLGQAVAGAWGRPYGDLLRERILRPLGLNDTQLSWRDADKTRLAPGHNATGPVHNWSFDAYTPVGALVSTARELARFVQANLGLVDTPLASVLAEATKPLAERAGKDKQIGLAWQIDHHGDTTVIWHNGLTGGYHSFLAFDPAKKQGIVLLANHPTALEPLGFALLAGRMPAAKSAPLPAATALTEYLGNYALTPSFVMAVTTEGERLYLQATNQPRLSLQRQAGDNFAVVGVEAAVSFERDAAGKVVALILHQNGRDQRAERVP